MSIIKLERTKMTLHNLRVYPLIYLATPYRKYPGGMEVAFEMATDLLGRLQVNGINAFCPIVHGHPTSKRGHTNPMDHSFWMRVDAPFIRVCNALLVAEMETWKDSDGISEEIVAFERDGKPVHYLNPNSLAIR